MKKIIVIALLFHTYGILGQSGTKKLDSLKKAVSQYSVALKSIPVADTNKILNNEYDIKEQLVIMALKNPQAAMADANVRIAEIARRKANSSFLGFINIGGNVNEFVINNSPAANFFPKYNFGLNLPLDMFAKNKAEKRTSKEVLMINLLEKQQINESLKAKVLIQYESYKEKKQLLELQRILLDDDLTAYGKAQKDYKDNIISFEDLNKIYSELIKSKVNLSTKEKEFNISIIELEETIGVPLNTILIKRTI